MATANKTQPTPEDVDAFISRVDDRKRADAVELISCCRPQPASLLSCGARASSDSGHGTTDMRVATKVTPH
ncbi:hypothetical protein ACETU7_05510 [Rhodococcus sp. 3Y1]